MSLENFIISAYCLVDETLKKLVDKLKLRQRRFEPNRHSVNGSKAPAVYEN